VGDVGVAVVVVVGDGGDVVDVGEASRVSDGLCARFIVS
jgi:hypothetical protein